MPDLTHHEYGMHPMVLCDDGGSAEIALHYKKLPGERIVHTPRVQQNEQPRVRRMGASGKVRDHEQPMVVGVDVHAGRGRCVAVAEFSLRVRRAASVAASGLGWHMGPTTVP